MQSRAIAFAVMLTLAPAAWAQAVRAEGAASAAADADAAMERAKRAAAGPLRAIQQASKIRRRPGEGEAVAPAAAAPAATPTSTTASTSAPSTVLAVSGASASVPAAAAPVPAPAPAPPPERAVERAEAPAVARVLEAEARMPTVAAVAAIEAPAAAVATPTMPTMAVSQPLLDTLPMQPKVLSMVEPNIPPRVMEQGPRVAEVEAELMLRADGSVAGVTLLPPVPRAWQRYITAALEQWRFEPLGAARTHRVRLVFSAPN